MKIYGTKKTDTNTEGVFILSDVSISINLENLKELAKFFNEAATELESMGKDFSHVHLQDKWSGWHDGLPDIQVFNETV